MSIRLRRVIKNPMAVSYEHTPAQREMPTRCSHLCIPLAVVAIEYGCTKTFIRAVGNEHTERMV